MPRARYFDASYLAVVAEWSKALSQIQVERMPQVPGSNPAWGMYLYGTVMDPLYICYSTVKYY